MAANTVKVTVKHGKKKHKGIEIDLEGMSLEGLGAVIFSLTQVLPERQKIIVKGKQIENDSDISSIIKNKSVLVVMGSAEDSLAVTTTNTSGGSGNGPKFMEDMTDADLQEVNAVLPPGLYNLGNTCYLNSTLQCMRGVRELTNGLINNETNYNGFSKSLSQLFSSMNSTSDSINPTSFVQSFRTRFPEFATRNEQGVWEQQDADECLTKLLNTIKSDDNNSNLINDLFEGEFESEMKCLEVGLDNSNNNNDNSNANNKDGDTNDNNNTEVKTDESKESNALSEVVGPLYEPFYKLQCFIDSETRHISFGIEKSLNVDLEKHSNILNRNAQWRKTSKISKLPKYLTISIVRFFWKQSKQKNAKILKSIQFDMKFDISKFCNKTLKDKISKFRRLKMEKEDAEREKKQSEGIKINKDDKDKNKDSAAPATETSTTTDAATDSAAPQAPAADGDIEMGDSNTNNNNSNGDGNAGADAAATTEEKGDGMDIDKPAEEEYESGFYELIGLITHKGLSANSGHYIGYSKDEKRGWLKFDDDVVTEVSEDDIKKLYGGGQWQMGYVTFYRKVEAKL